MLLTLLTDFGLQDAYVAIMKGTIAQINPRIQVIDVTHQIAPQDIAAARFQLMNAYPYFPRGTVHVAVVDPGVGSTRRAIAVQLTSGFLVGPDNGVLSGVLSQGFPIAPEIIAAVELDNPNYWRVLSPSSTFHGRDIFAAVGAHLASGVPLQKVGTEIDAAMIVQLPIPQVTRTQTGKTTVLTGCIQAIDHFGNLITNISESDVIGKNWHIKIGDASYASQTTYADAQPQEVLALVGSHGWVEIAANGASAQAKLCLSYGSFVQAIVQ